MTANHIPQLEDDPLWYKDAVFYELHVRAFYDSDGDGIGDFRGLTEKLDYLQDLGVTALWLLPFYPSPLKDDGYDIANYTDVHPSYGTLQDFRAFLRTAHRRGLRVIGELVLNHTSDQHPWFRRAREAKPGSSLRDFYVWSDTPEKYRGVRIIFRDFEPSNWSWDPIAKAYYWHRFYSHQPDLNYDNARVRRAVTQAVDFWLGMGMDGLRLDAVPYLFEREGTTCENLPETHAFLKRLRRHVDQRFANRVILAEANMWPEDAGAYFGKGDECHMAFHFPLMPRLFMGIRMEDRFPIIDIIQQTPPIPESAQWALFLRNHDELTLEMVTDEDRDYMYRMYAQDPRARINLGIRHRLAPLLNNDRRKIELMKGLLFSLPGTPVIYYGDEIGMGDNIYLGDRNGVRTPMQWSADRNAGFSRANPQRLFLPVIIDPEYHYEAVNVEAQQSNSESTLWWMKRLIALRRRYTVLGNGSLEFLHPDNRKILAYLRSHQEERILVVANLSRFAQHVELDLGRFAGMTPVELFGRTRFPTIEGDAPYCLTLGPYSFFWLALQPAPVIELESYVEDERPPVITVREEWERVLDGKCRLELEAALPGYLRRKRWFRSKARTIVEARVVETVPVAANGEETVLALVQVEFSEGESELYVLPLAYAPGDGPGRGRDDLKTEVLARIRLRPRGEAQEEGLLFDPFAGNEFPLTLVEAIGKRRRFRGSNGVLTGLPTGHFRQTVGALEQMPRPSHLRVEQTNTSTRFGDRLILKLYRRIEEGVNPDLELGRYLTEAGFGNTPAIAGALEYRRGKDEPMTVATLQAYVPNEGDAWSYTLDTLRSYFQQALEEDKKVPAEALRRESLVALAQDELPPDFDAAIGPYLAAALLLGLRTAEMHRLLASNTQELAFAPEPFTAHYQRSMYQSARGMAREGFDLLRRRAPGLEGQVRQDAEHLLALEDSLIRRLRSILEQPLAAQRTRCHMDYHLGQLLYTGKDFVIIDFEGEPARPLSQRRMKRSPLTDMAGMIRSFHYAAHTAVRETAFRPEDTLRLLPWARFWWQWVSVACLQSYLRAVGQVAWLPKSRYQLELLLNFLLLEKALYELRYELNNRPNWVDIPIAGLLNILREG